MKPDYLQESIDKFMLDGEELGLFVTLKGIIPDVHFCLPKWCSIHFEEGKPPQKARDSLFKNKKDKEVNYLETKKMLVNMMHVTIQVQALIKQLLHTLEEGRESKPDNQTNKRLH